MNTVWSIVTIATMLAAGEPRLVTVEGGPMTARFAGAEADGRWTFQDGEDVRSLPAGEVVLWGDFAEPAQGPWLILADGGLVLADVLKSDQDRLSVDSLLFGPQKLPLESLAGVVFQQPAARRERDRLYDRLAQATGDSDRLVLDNVDELTGFLEAVEEKTVKFRAEVGSLELPRSRVAAIILNPSLRRKPAAESLRVWAGFSDGSRLLASNLVSTPTNLSGSGSAVQPEGATGSSPARANQALADKPPVAPVRNFRPLSLWERARVRAWSRDAVDALTPGLSRAPTGGWSGRRETREMRLKLVSASTTQRLTPIAQPAAEQTLSITAAGVEWTAHADKLVALQPLGGRAVYLSDVKPLGYRHVPFLDLSWPYRQDRSVTGEFLRCGGQLYLKGLGMHSASRLSYALDRPYRFFQAEIGLDDTAGGQGSVRFRVLLDGQERFASDILRGGQPPVPISIDIQGGKRLGLLVEFADRADVLDRACWLSARFIP